MYFYGTSIIIAKNPAAQTILNRKTRPFFAVGISKTRYKTIYKLLYDLRFAQNATSTRYVITIVYIDIITFGV